MSGMPYSAPPVSGPPVPPWGMTAPPWSSVAPPQPLALTVEEPDAAPDPRDGVDRPAEKPDAPYAGWEPETGPAPAPPPRSPGPEPSVPRLDASAAAPFPVLPPPSTVPPSPHRDHRSDATEQGPAERGPGAVDWAEQQPAEHRPAEHGQGQGQQEGQAWHERDGWRADDGYPSPPDAWQTTYQEKERAGRGRTVVLVAVVALVALAIVVGVAVLVFGRDEAPPPGATPASASAAPKVSGPPPGGLKLRDDSSTISLTWTDPSSGAVPFMVAGGRTGQKLGVLATVDPGQTSYTVNGLNSRVDYCFTVLAVYSTDAFATSGQVCTARGPAPTPS
ncbi:fibronectin type III domain-containing protein [Micromonospora sp. NPDC020751]|uniref:fibronectin type III domain-containing protein n=2 Tax=unclassified Micromonospora TaxID=2617518 RepID=UPI00378BB1D9